MAAVQAGHPLDRYHKKLGDVLHELRSRRHLTQEQLAKKADVSARTVREIEDGRQCYVLTFVTLLQVMGFGWEDVFKIDPSIAIQL